VQLERKTSSAESNHNDYELLLFEAHYRSVLDVALLLETTLECVRSEKASATHRVGAAALAMKVAVDFGRADLLDSVFRDVAPYFGDPSVREFDCLQIKTIYGTMRGDRPVPVGELNRLASAGHQVNGELGYSRALMMAVTACRMSARYEEGLEFANRALEHARANRFRSRHHEILVWTIALHISARRFDEAKKALSSILNNPFLSDSVKERHEVFLLEARLGIEEGDFSRAASAFTRAEPMYQTYSLARRCYYLALQLRIRMNEGASADILRPLVAELETLNGQLRGFTAQDFESHALLLGLTAIGEEERGRGLFREYVKQRRVKWRLSPEANELLRDEEAKRTRERSREEPAYETAALRTVPLSGVV
jgi:hypothetical protein